MNWKTRWTKWCRHIRKSIWRGSIALFVVVAMLFDSLPVVSVAEGQELPPMPPQTEQAAEAETESEQATEVETEQEAEVEPEAYTKYISGVLFGEKNPGVIVDGNHNVRLLREGGMVLTAEQIREMLPKELCIMAEATRGAEDKYYYGEIPWEVLWEVPEEGCIVSAESDFIITGTWGEPRPEDGKDISGMATTKVQYDEVVEPRCRIGAVRQERYIDWILEDAFTEIDEDGNLTATLLADTVLTQELLEELLPYELEATVLWKSAHAYAEAEWMYWGVDWDTKELVGKTLTPGSIVIKGSWGQPEEEFFKNGMNAAQVTSTRKSEYDKVLEPACKVQIIEKVGLALPEIIYYYGKTQPEGVRVELPSEMISVQTGQMYPQDARFNVKIREKGSEEWTKIDGWRGIAHVDNDSTRGARLQLSQFGGSPWLQDEGVYEIIVETTLWAGEEKVELTSNIMTVNMTTDSSQIPPDAGDGDTDEEEPPVDDGSSGGNRGGGSRGTQDSDTTKKLSSGQLETLAKANPAGTALVLDGTKVILNSDTMADWAKEGMAVEFSGQMLDENKFKLELLQDNQRVSWIDSEISLRIPVKKDLKLMKGLSGEKAELQLTAKRDGVLLCAGYYDSKAEEMVIKTDRTGTFEIEKGTPKKFLDTAGHWAEKTIDFASVRGMVSGYENRTVQPERAVSSGEFRTMLGKCLPVSRAGSATRQTEGTLTRLEAAELIYEVCGGKPEKLGIHVKQNANKGEGFRDTAGLSAKEKACIAFVQESGLMNGRGDGLFSPAASMTRAEALALTVNIIKQ